MSELSQSKDRAAPQNKNQILSATCRAIRVWKTDRPDPPGHYDPKPVVSKVPVVLPTAVFFLGIVLRNDHPWRSGKDRIALHARAHDDWPLQPP